jgi:hypothetical protein
MTAAKYSITIEQGATFNLDMTIYEADDITIRNLTGFTARMMVRQKYSSTSPLLTATTENGKIVLGGALGTVAVTFSAADTAALVVKKGVYDFELVSAGGVVERLLRGAVIISPEATK